MKHASENSGDFVVVGAACALGDGERHARGTGELSVEIEECVEMSDGARVSVRWDRGIGVSLNGFGQLSEQELLEHLEGALLPDGGEAEDQCERRSWHEYAILLAVQGIEVSAQELKSLPCRTELPPGLRDQLQP